MFWYLLLPFGIIWYRFGIVWYLLESFGKFWYRLVSFGIFSNQYLSLPIFIYPYLFSFNFSLYLILSTLILSYLIVSYRILSYCILSYHILSYLILSYLILSYHIIMSKVHKNVHDFSDIFSHLKRSNHQTLIPLLYFCTDCHSAFASRGSFSVHHKIKHNKCVTCGKQ